MQPSLRLGTFLDFCLASFGLVLALATTFVTAKCQCSGAQGRAERRGGAVIRRTRVLLHALVLVLVVLLSCTVDVL